MSTHRCRHGVKNVKELWNVLICVSVRYEELLKEYKPVFVAGGAAQNAARAAAVSSTCYLRSSKERRALYLSLL